VQAGGWAVRGEPEESLGAAAPVWLRCQPVPAVDDEQTAIGAWIPRVVRVGLASSTGTLGEVSEQAVDPVVLPRSQDGSAVWEIGEIGQITA
jgi:hypothetical protein